MKNSEKLKKIYEESSFSKFYCTVDGYDQSQSAKIREFLEGVIEADDEIEELAEGLIGVMEQVIDLHNGDKTPEYTF